MKKKYRDKKNPLCGCYIKLGYDEKNAYVDAWQNPQEENSNIQIYTFTYAIYALLIHINSCILLKNFVLK